MRSASKSPSGAAAPRLIAQGATAAGVGARGVPQLTGRRVGSECGAADGRVHGRHSEGTRKAHGLRAAGLPKVFCRGVEARGVKAVRAWQPYFKLPERNCLSRSLRVWRNTSSDSLLQRTRLWEPPWRRSAYGERRCEACASGGHPVTCLAAADRRASVFRPGGRGRRGRRRRRDRAARQCRTPGTTYRWPN